MVIHSYGKLTFSVDDTYEYRIWNRHIFNPENYGFILSQHRSKIDSFFCFYAVLNDQLYLRHLIIDSENYPTLNNVVAKESFLIHQYDWIDLDIGDQYGYFNLNLKLDFTGTIDVSDELSVEPKYELFFKNGIFQKKKKHKINLYPLNLNNLKNFLIRQL